MAQVIVISSAFPPLGSTGGTIRLVKLVKYLSSLNWKFVVFTQDPLRPIVPEKHLSEVLLEDLPKEITVFRIPAPFTPIPTQSVGNLEKVITGVYKSIFRDSALPWGIKVFLNSLSYIWNSEVDLILGTAPPFTNVLIAMLIGWAAKKPFVLDLRDDWVGLPIFYRKNIMRQKIEIFLESLVVRSASAVITVTPQSHDLYQNRYAYLGQHEKFHLVPNGCDLDEYSILQNREAKIVSERFLILSTAWWYRSDRRDATPLFLALDMFFRRRSVAKDKVEVIFLGDSLSSEYDQLLTDLQLDKVVRRYGIVPRDELMEWLWKADLFLLAQPAGNTTAISGTLYEYWATGKAPVLLISEEGASSGLVEKYRIGRHFFITEIQKISTYIEEMFDAYGKGKPVWIDRKGVEAFDRKLLASRMDIICRQIIPGE